MFKTKKLVKVFHFAGSEYECQYRIQYLVKRFYFLGIPFWQRTLDQEDVPNHVWISINTLGFCSCNWRSKFAQYII